jgi:iron(III) transport system substrate-binding protein
VDSDDAVNRIRQNRPVRIVFPDQDGMGVFIVPNAVMMVKGGPHPAAAKRLVDYLLSPEVEALLAKEDCAQIPLHPGVKPPPEIPPIEKLKTLRVDYAKVARRMVSIQPFLKAWTGL